MRNRLTLTELKRRGDEAFLDAQAAIDTARQLARDCRELNADLKRTRADFKRAREPDPSEIIPATS